MSDGQPITSPYSPDLEQVKTWLEKMVKSMRFVELIAAVLALIARMREVNAELLKQLTNMRRKRPRSETLERIERQLSLPLGATAAAKRDHEREPAEETASRAVPKTKQSRKGRHPGRGALPSHIERIDVPNPVPPELRTCPECGSLMTTVGHTVCERLNVIPARIVVERCIDETVACPHDDTIVSAPPPNQLVERGKLGETLVVEAMADKYLEHLPIERQCLRYERAGVDIAPQTLGRSVAVGIDLLEPIAKVIREMTRGPGLLSTDWSGIPVLDRDAADGIRVGSMACWINRSWVSFVYSPSGDSESVRRFLGDNLARDVQCDGTNLTSFIERAGGKRPGCWSHARRRLAEAARSGDLLALEGLRKIRRLFAVERLSAIAGDSAEGRLARRTQHSRPIIIDLRAWIDEHRKTIPPKTPMGQALRYLHRQWHRLVLFLEDGALELTNNRVEREIRKLVLGRKNWLFVWEDLGGERAANILTIVSTCVACGINPRRYLHLVTKLLVDRWPASRLKELLPDRIAGMHPELRTRAPNALPAAVEVRGLPLPDG
jgi:transposase